MKNEHPDLVEMTVAIENHDALDRNVTENYLLNDKIEETDKKLENEATSEEIIIKGCLKTMTEHFESDSGSLP